MELWKTIFVTVFIAVFPYSASGELGFYAVRDGQAPEPVLAAAKNVLEIWTPGLIREIPQSQYASRARALREQKESDFESAIRLRINRVELEECVRQRLPMCALSQSLSRNSAFVVNGNVLVTARHAFAHKTRALARRVSTLAAGWTERWRDPRQQARVQWETERFKRDPLSVAMFFLTDAQGHLIFRSSRQNFRFLRFGSLTTIRGEVNVQNSVFKARVMGDDLGLAPANVTAYQNDIALVELSVSLPTLNSASQGCEPGQPSYIIGYPAPTEDRGRYGFADARDRVLSWTRGEFLNLEQVLRRARQWQGAGQFVQEAEGRPLIFSSADGNHGMSGGLIANSRGEACGVFFGAWPGSAAGAFDPQDGSFMRFSFGPAL